MFLDIHFKGSTEYDEPTTYEVDGFENFTYFNGFVLIYFKPESHKYITAPAIFNADVIYSMFIREK